MRITSLLTAALLAVPALANATDNSRVALDWEGRYTGLVPCASCPGIETTLTLNEAGYFTLRETYQNETRDSHLEEGQFTWDKAGEVITLPLAPERHLKVSEGSVAFLTTTGTPASEDYILTKLDEFNGGGEQLFVNPVSIEDHGEGNITFRALTNLEFADEVHGTRSETSTIALDCNAGLVKMTNRARFPELDATGTATEANAAERPLTEGEDVLWQAAKTYCP